MTAAPNGLDHDTLRAIAERFPPYRVEGQGYRCRCPVHDDHDPSLDITMGDKGVPVVTCRAGCDQGQVWAAVRPPRQPKPGAGRRITATYDYTDEHGVVLYQAVRFEPKDFRQRQPDGAGGWRWSMAGVRYVPYHLPTVIASNEVLVVEGEKDADNLARLGLAATTNVGGAEGQNGKSKWRPEYAQALKGKHVIILPDNDPPGRRHARVVAASLAGLAATVRVLELPGLPEKGDVSDWLAKGGTLEQLRALARDAPAREDWTPEQDESEPLRVTRPRDAPAREAWKAKLERKGEGFAKLECNILIALREAPELAGRVRLNQLTEQVEATDMPWCPGRGWEAWDETDDTLLADWLQRVGIEVRPGQCGGCAVTVARANPHHPVRSWLGGLAWDGVPRLSSWLATHLGAHDAPEAYIRAVGRAWLISLVARAMRPGCQVDHLLILEGPQGARKSSALRALVPDPAWFTDNISALGTKDSAQDLRGKLLIELSDLSAMKRTEVERIKAALSHPVDHYRPSYGRYSRDFPRQCVFAGTTNEHAYLFDSTGNRRFWCLKVGAVRLADLERDRDQLWVEARDAFLAGEKWHLEPAIEQLASLEQAKRREEEPFTGPVLDWVAQTAKPEFHIVDIMRGIGIVDTSKHTKAEAMRIAAILRDAGCTRRHTEHGSAWRRLTPAEGCQEVSAQEVRQSPNDFNNILETDTSTTISPKPSHAHAHERASRAGTHAHTSAENPKKGVRVSAALESKGNRLDTKVSADTSVAWLDEVCALGDDREAQRAVIRRWLAALRGGMGEDGYAYYPADLSPADLANLTTCCAMIGLPLRPAALAKPAKRK